MRLPPRAHGAIAAVRDSEAFRAALRVAVSTRAAVLLVAVFAALSFGPASGGLARENAEKFDDPSLTHVLADPLLAPLARWDSVWYLRIADSGLRGQRAAGRVLPALPAAGAGAWRTPFGGSEAALLVAAYAVSLAAFLARAVPAVPAHRARAGPPARAAHAAAAGRLPGGRVLRRALLGEPLPAAGGGRLLRGADRPLGLGGRLRGTRIRPRAAPGCCS